MARTKLQARLERIALVAKDRGLSEVRAVRKTHPATGGCILDSTANDYKMDHDECKEVVEEEEYVHNDHADESMMHALNEGPLELNEFLAEAVVLHPHRKKICARPGAWEAAEKQRLQYISDFRTRLLKRNYSDVMAWMKEERRAKRAKKAKK
jgi:hypothetical protein